MKPETRRILDSPELLAARESWFVRLDALFETGSPGDGPFYLNGYHGKGRTDPRREPERWLEEVLDDLALHADLLLDQRVFRPLVVPYDPFGVHFVDRIFGADVFDLDGSWQARTLASPVGSLRPPDLETEDTWNLARRLTRAFVEAEVRVPLFGLPTIASALNIGVNLYGEELLVALKTRPDEARRDLTLINGVLVSLHRWYLATLPTEQLQPIVAGFRTQPRGRGQLCGCTCHLVSAEDYRDFGAPLDRKLLAAYPRGGMIHLCGAHTQHLDTWRAMKELSALQMNDRAAEDLPIYFAGTRPDQILYVNPCPGMPVERVLEITKGRRTVIVSQPTTPAGSR